MCLGLHQAGPPRETGGQVEEGQQVMERELEESSVTFLRTQMKHFHSRDFSSDSSAKAVRGVEQKRGLC